MIISGNAQQWNLELRNHLGKWVKNHPDLPSNSDAAFLIELRWNKNCIGQQSWHYSYKKPELGLSLSYISTGNNEVFGDGISVLPHMSFTGKQQKLSWNLSLGLGLAVFTKKYDRENNPYNIAIGSRINNAAHGSLGINYKINPQFTVVAGASAWHFSNGNFASPNIGINIPAFYFGAKFYSNSKTYRPKLEEPIQKEHFKPKLQYNLRLSMGLKESGVPNGYKQFVYVLGFSVNRYFSPIWKLQAGLEYDYDTGMKDFLTILEIRNEPNLWDYSRMSFNLGSEMRFGKMGFLVNGGIYIKNNYLKSSLFMSRLAFNYYPLSTEKWKRDKLYFTLGMRANFGEAEFVEFGLGYAF